MHNGAIDHTAVSTKPDSALAYRKARGLRVLLLSAGFIALSLSSACTNTDATTSQAPVATDTGERPYSEVAVWESAIADFEQSDRLDPPKDDSIVFVGSSSIVLWDSLAADMAPLPVIQRGFGGSKIYDAVYYADRIVWPYKPKAIVMFSGSNDLIVPDPDAAMHVEQGFIDFVDDTRQVYPGIDIHYISISLTGARWAARDDIREANAKIAAIAAKDDSLFYIDTASSLMKDGKPDPDLFRDDRLHLNAKGYAIWADIIRPHLMALYGE